MKVYVCISHAPESSSLVLHRTVFRDMRAAAEYCRRESEQTHIRCDFTECELQEAKDGEAA